MTAKSSREPIALQSYCTCVVIVVIVIVIMLLVEELQDVYEQAKGKHKEESRKLYNVSYYITDTKLHN